MKSNKVTSLFIVCLLLSSCGHKTTSVSDSSQDNSVSTSSISSNSTSSCEHDFVVEDNKNTTLSILEPVGGKKYTCSKCGEVRLEGVTYDLSQYAFENQAFVYDGKEHALTIKGMLPYGCTVEYENNTLKDKGNKEATAKVYDAAHQLIDEKKATISVIDNNGLYNIYVDTSNVEIVSKEEYVTMKLSTDNCPSDYVKTNVAGGIRCRGNGTYTYDKKPYRIKFSSKTNMFGLNNGAKAKSWVLLAEYADQSMVRNSSAFYLGNSLFNYSNNYCSDYMPVNLYLNGEYHGLYVLAEQQQANANRIRINEADEDVTATDVGYLVELDSRASQEDYYFSVGKGSLNGSWGQNGDPLDGTYVTGRDYAIKTDVYSQDQVNFIKKYITNVYYALYKAVHGDGLYVLDKNNELKKSPYTSQYETLNSIIDLESVFKMYLLYEHMKDIDVGFGSFYMFVDFSSTGVYKRLTFGAPWDFDWSSGNVNDNYVAKSDGEYCSNNQGNYNPWFFMFSKTDFFRSMMKKYYSVFKNSNILEGAINQANYFASAYQSDYAKNYSKWKNLGTIVPKYTPNVAKQWTKHQDAVDYFTDWLTKRKTALDKIFKE